MASATEKRVGNGEEATSLAPVPAKPNAAMTRRGIEPQTLEEAYRFATALSRSTIVPATYQKNPDNCLIALDLAARLNSNWLSVMQHVYVVHGRPGLDANMSIGLVNQSGLFDPIQYEVEGKDARDANYRVRAYSKRRGTEIVLYGPWIDWKLIKGEGWDRKEGSKWLTMPDQMFHYRAGAWWQKRHCPEMTLGMPTTDELDDAGDRKPVESKTLEPTNGRKPFGFTPEQPTETETVPEGTVEPPAAEPPAPEAQVAIETPQEDLYTCRACGWRGEKLLRGGACPKCRTKNIVATADLEPDFTAPTPTEVEQATTPAPKPTVRCLSCKREYAVAPKVCECGSLLGWKELK